MFLSWINYEPRPSFNHEKQNHIKSFKWKIYGCDLAFITSSELLLWKQKKFQIYQWNKNVFFF